MLRKTTQLLVQTFLHQQSPLATMQEEIHEASSDEESTDESATKRPRTASPRSSADPFDENINYLACEIETPMVHTFKSILLTDGVANATRPLLRHGKTALLISFKDWEQVARFYEWSSRGSYTRCLTTALRIQCGSILGNSDVFNTANEILAVHRLDSIVTQVDVDQEPLTEEQEQTMSQDECHKFHLYMLNGVFCKHCQSRHRPFRPSH